MLKVQTNGYVAFGLHWFVDNIGFAGWIAALAARSGHCGGLWCRLSLRIGVKEVGRSVAVCVSWWLTKDMRGL